MREEALGVVAQERAAAGFDASEELLEQQGEEGQKTSESESRLRVCLVESSAARIEAPVLVVVVVVVWTTRQNKQDARGLFEGARGGV